MEMRRTIYIILTTILVVLLTSTLTDYAYGAGGYHGGGYHGGGYYGGGYHGGGYHGGGYYGGVWIGPGWGWGGWGPWWGAPYYPYYASPPVVEQQAPVYVEPTPQREEQSYWYYCQNPEGYYPYVQNCPGGWMKVVPQPAPPK
jgi:hypothetical protein